MPKIVKRPRHTNLYLGFDPGANGGIAMLTEDHQILRMYAMPEAELDIVDLFEEIGLTVANHNFLPIGVCEAVNAFGQRKKGQASIFTFGRNYGFLRACVTYERIRMQYVASAKWQKEIGFTKKTGEEYNARKKRLLAYAMQLFPNADWPSTQGARLKVCDALLIAEYCRKVNS